MSEPIIKIELYSNKPSIDKGFQELIKKAKNKKQILRELSQSILDYIDDAFESEGKNIQGEKWQNWSQNYYDKVRKKIGGQILQLNGDLRKSIQRKVNDENAVISTALEYAAIHNFGMNYPNKRGVNPHMPKRTFMDFTENLTNKLETELWGLLDIDGVERMMDERIKFLRGE